MTTGMIVLAGGIGKRIGRPFPKQFLLLGGKPLIIHVLEKARAISAIERVVSRPHRAFTKSGSPDSGSSSSTGARRAARVPAGMSPYTTYLQSPGVGPEARSTVRHVLPSSNDT